VVAVFAKAPRAGQVKTRLAGALGAEGAARLHERLATRAVETAVAAGLGPVQLWCAPDSSHAFFARMERRFGVALCVQSGEDLGARMAHAMDAAFRSGHRVVLIGADCPDLVPADLHDAAEALRSHDAVFMPAEDGGYVLAGAARPLPIFGHMPWGTGHVMSRTRERLREAGATWRELRTSWDVDRPEDLGRLQQSGLLEGAGS
jgi:uncharacterized protein